MSTQPTHAGGVPEWTLGDRMRKSLQAAGISVQEIADYLEVSRNSPSNWINDRITPNKQTRRLWAMRTGVPLEWLETGTADDDDPDDGLPRLDSDQQPFDLFAARSLHPRTTTGHAVAA